MFGAFEGDSLGKGLIRLLCLILMLLVLGGFKAGFLLILC